MGRQLQLVWGLPSTRRPRLGADLLVDGGVVLVMPTMSHRWYISRANLLACSRRGPDGRHRVDALERLARRLGLALPRLPRHWHGYRHSLVGRIARWVSKPCDDMLWR